MGIANVDTKLQLSEEIFSCPKEQIVHKELSLALNMLKQHTYIDYFENSMKASINSIENSVDPYQLVSEEAS